MPGVIDVLCSYVGFVQIHNKQLLQRVSQLMYSNNVITLQGNQIVYLRML